MIRPATGETAPRRRRPGRAAAARTAARLPRRRLGAGLLAAGLLLAAAVLPAAAQEAAGPAQPDGGVAGKGPAGKGALRLDYAVYLGGLNPVDVQARLELAEGRYDLRLQARTDGFVGRLLPFVLEARGTGRRGRDGLQPARFATANSWRGNPKRWVRLTYPDPAAGGAALDGARAPEVNAEPAPAADDRPVVPEAARRGTWDPLSGLVGLLLGPGPACAGERAIFDGRRRFDVTAERLGPDPVPESGYAVYAGPATRCRVEVTPVTGFWEKYRAKQRYPRTVEVWLAPVAEGWGALPVRLEAETPAGALRVHLRGLRRGAAAALPDSGLFPLRTAQRE